MTTTTSYSKKIFFGLYKAAIKRMRGFFLLYTLLSVLFLPVAYVVQIMSDKQNNIQGYRLYGSVEIYSMASLVIYFAVLVMASIMIGCLINAFMHNKRAVDIYHSLPIGRVGLLLANFLAAVTLMAVPIILSYGILAVVAIDVAPIAIMAEAFRVSCLMIALVSIAFFCSVASNQIADSVLFTIALSIIVPSFYMLFNLTISICLKGILISTDSILKSMAFSPIAMLYDIVLSDVTSVAYSFPPIVYLLFSLAVVILSCRVYHSRKSENLQNLNANGLLYRLIMVSASLGVSVIASYITARAMGLNIDAQYPLLIITSGIYGGLCYFIFNMVLTKNIKISKRNAIYIGVSGLLPAMLLISAIYGGFFGMEGYIPRGNNVKAVEISYDGTYRGIYGDIYNTQVPEFKDIDSKQAIADVHERILQDVKKHNNTNIYNSPLDIAYTMDTFVEQLNQTDYYTNFWVCYKLDNGKKVKRSYYGMISKETRDMLVNLENLPEFKAKISPIQNSSADMVRTFEIYDGFARNFRTLNLTDEEKQKLFLAIKEDEYNLTLEEKINHTGPILSRISILYNNAPKKLGDDPSNIRPYYTGVSFDVTINTPKTIEALTALNLTEYVSGNVPEDIAAAYNLTFYSYSDPNGFTQATNFDQNVMVNTFYNYMESSNEGILLDKSYINEIMPYLKTYSNNMNTNQAVVLFTDTDQRAISPEKNTNGMYRLDNTIVYIIDNDNIPEFMIENLYQRKIKGGY